MAETLTVECTGVAAVWCPIHGDCTCRKRLKASGASGEFWGRDDCPLHGTASSHPDDSWTPDPLDVLRTAHYGTPTNGETA